ncbi:MAG: hypothetical protein M1548_06180 [Actinobacteria bacterium]|nr:hypothetical protein [Actinomycetota bacterium]
MEDQNALEVIVLDVDEAIVRQKRLLEKYRPTVIPLRDRSEALRYWCRIEELERLRQLLASSVGTVKGKVIFYGSGDYHHLAYLGISLMDEPVTIIHFDNHTDFGRSRQRYIHAGSWVVNSLELSHVRKVIQLGIDGDLSLRKDIPMPIGPVTHKISLLCDGKVEVYPNSMHRSVLFGRVRATLPCVEFKPRLLTTEANWKNIQDHGGIEATLERILPAIPTDAVYLTIDKDVLRESDSFTNYLGMQGSLILNELLAAISLIGRRKRIIGADVCGDGSYSAARGYPLKRFFARLKDRKIHLGSFYSQENIRLNEDVNLKILERLMEQWK